MPTETFLKLPQSKKEKIMIAGKKEFARVPISEASIQNIVKNAEIARGSFYQYFESKTDLMYYIIISQMEDVKNKLEKVMEETDGDIFEAYIALYDYIIEKCKDREIDGEFYKKVFENTKASENSIFTFKEKWDIKQKLDIDKIYQKVNVQKMKYKSKEEIELIVKTMNIITKTAIACTIKSSEIEKGRNDYIKQLEFIKKGIL